MKRFFVVPDNQIGFHVLCEEEQLNSILSEANITSFISTEVPLHDTYNEYLKFCKENCNLTEDQFFEELQTEFRADYLTILDIWYSCQRSWFKPFMAEVMLIMGQEKNHPVYNFKPMFTLGEHKWNGYKFVELS